MATGSKRRRCRDILIRSQCAADPWMRTDDDDGCAAAGVRVAVDEAVQPDVEAGILRRFAIAAVGRGSPAIDIPAGKLPICREPDRWAPHEHSRSSDPFEIVDGSWVVRAEDERFTPGTRAFRFVAFRSRR